MKIIGKKKIELAASMACADFANLGNDIKELEDAKIDIFHFDICDGYFAPTFLLSPIIIKSLRPLTKARFDVHLYCNYPSRYVYEIAESGADLVIIHIEARENYKKVLKQILGCGLKAGIAILPDSKIPSDLGCVLSDVSLIVANTVGPAYAGQKFDRRGLDNIQKLRNIIKDSCHSPTIAADGGVNETTIKEIITSGAGMLILGSTGLFTDEKNYMQKVANINCLLDSIEPIHI